MSGCALINMVNPSCNSTWSSAMKIRSLRIGVLLQRMRRFKRDDASTRFRLSAGLFRTRRFGLQQCLTDEPCALADSLHLPFDARCRRHVILFADMIPNMAQQQQVLVHAPHRTPQTLLDRFVHLLEQTVDRVGM